MLIITFLIWHFLSWFILQCRAQLWCHLPLVDCSLFALDWSGGSYVNTVAMNKLITFWLQWMSDLGIPRDFVASLFSSGTSCNSWNWKIRCESGSRGFHGSIDIFRKVHKISSFTMNFSTHFFASGNRGRLLFKKIQWSDKVLYLLIHIR